MCELSNVTLRYNLEGETEYDNEWPLNSSESECTDCFIMTADGRSAGRLEVTVDEIHS